MKTIRFFALLAISSVIFACEPEAQPGDDNGGTNTEQPGDNTGGNNGDNTQQEPDDPNATTFNVVSEALADAVSAWAEADTLGVYPEEGAPYAFTTSAAGITDGGKNAKFKGDKLDAESFYAVYPYGEDVILVGNELELILPYSHVAEGVGVCHSTDLKVGYTTEKTLNLYNVFGYLKVNVAEEGVKQVVIRSIKAQNFLAGKASVIINENAAPEVTVLDGVPHVVLVPAEGQATIATGTYYIPVVPGTMEQGVSIRFKKGLKMYVKEDEAPVTVARNGVTDFGTLATGGSFDEYEEFVINDDAAGFTGCYREYGTNSISTAPHYLWHAGDGDITTFWNMPSGALSGGTGEAYDINGKKTIRGSYLRLDVNLSSQGPAKGDACPNRVDRIIFEYEGIYHPDNVELTGGHDWMPWTLDVRTYNVKQPDGSLKYGTLQHLTVEDDALPWTWEYNNLYVSNIVKRSHSVDNYKGAVMHGLILCCTRTRDNIDNVLQPKDAIDGVEFRDLAKATPESQWGLAELRVWARREVK